ncbi:hypothetical protein CEXT_66251 [Caerostris extrusa]|uniref:Uncharacterized protein n=1 Tax=Caerostris extrusa TaxID=172846 RepID=A0AAV4RWL5_CAEEX|nr:hypothetical protein CEXT_66251 [Caerostris extrusa]
MPLCARILKPSYTNVITCNCSFICLLKPDCPLSDEITRPGYLLSVVSEGVFKSDAKEKCIPHVTHHLLYVLTKYNLVGKTIETLESANYINVIKL